MVDGHELGPLNTDCYPACAEMTQVAKEWLDRDWLGHPELIDTHFYSLVLRDTYGMVHDVPFAGGPVKTAVLTLSDGTRHAVVVACGISAGSCQSPTAR